MLITCLPPELDYRTKVHVRRTIKYSPEQANQLLADVMADCKVEVIELATVHGYCVYIYCSEDMEPLYIGSSAHGYKRVFGFTGLNDRACAIDESTQVIVLHLQDETTMLQTERDLIEAFKPCYNKTFNGPTRTIITRPSR